MAHQISGYRQDIQGLRAVAVGAIVIFHAFPSTLPGGFVGVDVFFVISGFLITGLIYRDIKRSTFSLADFYRKRVRRIFPALFVMLAVTLAIGFTLLSPEAYSELGRNTLSSIFFVSNVDFWRSSGYFDRTAELRPLLHTWSLAVEEQFYIAFPIFMVLMMRYARAMVMPSLIFGFALSLALSEWSLSDGRVGMGAYFLTPFRVYELVLGSMAAIAPAFVIFNRQGLRSFCVILGIIMILASVFLLSSNVHFPGTTALLPTVGTALILYVGKAGDCWPTKVLTLPPMLFIGSISYSLYLWHWPVFAFLRVTSEPGHPEGIEMLAATALAFVLATLSYRFIEQPVAWCSITAIPFLKLGGLGMATSAVVAGFIWQSGGVTSRFTPDTLQMFAAAEDISPERQRCHRLHLQEIPYDATCVLGRAHAAADTVVWGDSHGVELAYALGERVALDGRAVRQITGSACPPILGLELRGRPQCKASNDETLAALVVDDVVQRVILAMNADGYFKINGITFSDMHNGLTKTIAELRASGKDVILIGQIPNPHMDAPAIAGRALHQGRDPAHFGVSRVEVEQVAAQWHAALEEMAEQDGVSFVDLTPNLCGPDICSIVSEGEVLYFNSTHISMTAARRIVSALDNGS